MSEQQRVERIAGMLRDSVLRAQVSLNRGDPAWRSRRIATLMRLVEEHAHRRLRRYVRVQYDVALVEDLNDEQLEETLKAVAAWR